MPNLIDSIKLPAGLRELETRELETVAAELRDELIHSVSRSGGHFASSLGVVELSVALHSAFDTPHDRLVWDVGHQGYVHKMLTERRDRMGTIRQAGGLSGFLRRDESEYDSFGAGHAGTSISAGVGMALALKKERLANPSHPERYVVPIIGDGSLTAGMAFEALNHAGSLDLKNFIVVLNDNEMSISKNVGALSWFFSKAVTGETSTAARKQFKEWYKQGYIPDFVYKAIDRAEESAQCYFSEAALLFEAFGFRYIGPVDGHSIEDLNRAFQNAKLQDGPVVVHARTVKGKGYEAAEEDPLTWHGVKPFDPKLAQFAKGSKPLPPAYTDVFSNTLIELCKQDKKIIGITAAMPTGTGLDALQAVLPDQFIDVGICEQHAVTFAAGLACEGYKPVCAIYSTFLQRAYDQVIHDVCIQNLPVVFALDRAGAVGNDGETHQGLFDISYLRTIPNMVLLAPKDEDELRHMLYTAILHDGPIALRFPRGNGFGVPLQNPLRQIPIGKAEVLQHGEGVVFFTAGTTASTAFEVSRAIDAELGFKPSIINLRSLKPLDEECLREFAATHHTVVTIEDHALLGGVGSAVLEVLHESENRTDEQDILSGSLLGGSIVADKGRSDIPRLPRVLRFGAKDIFTPHGTQQEQYTFHGYDAQSILKEVRAILKEVREVMPAEGALLTQNLTRLSA